MTLAARVRTIQLALALAAVGGWLAIAASRAVNPLLLPAIPTVWRGAVRIASSGALWNAVAVTATTVVEAYLIAAVVGIVLGFALGRSRMLASAFEPLLAAIFAIPLVLFFPLFTVYLGIGPPSKIAFGAIYGFFPVALNTIAGFGNVDPLLVRSARSQGASAWQSFRHVYVPGALPVVAVGLRIGFFICFASVLGGETLSSAAGVGYAIHRAGELLDSGQMYAWIAYVLIATVILNLTAGALESRVRRR